MELKDRLKVSLELQELQITVERLPKGGSQIVVSNGRTNAYCTFYDNGTNTRSGRRFGSEDSIIKIARKACA